MSAPRAMEGPSRAARDAARAGLYVHVPFCAARCAYCDFSTGSFSSEALRRYLDALEREIARRAPACDGETFTTVFFGGGTPSALPGRDFRRIVRALRQGFAVAPGAEFTVEANPESVRPALLEAWRESGVNRLSMGAQSFDPDELARLGRIHDRDRPGEAFALARAHGFERLSLDLMFGYPGHGLATWEATLERALSLEPEHLSAYCFIPEPETPLGRAALSGAAPLPSPDAQADLYARLVERLEEAGLGIYETSNFCRPGAEARHNLVYWLRRPYVGLGPSAHGFVHGVRYGNAWSLADWAERIERGESPEAEREPESDRSRAEEIVMLGLRLANGVRFGDHAPDVARDLERRFGEAFDEAVATGRLERDAEGVRIPGAHRFVADDVIAWVAARAERRRVDSRFDGSVPSPSCPNPRSPVG